MPRIFLLLAASLILPRLASAQGRPPERIREVYVPYAELHARLGQDPRGVVMTLDEYRKLVLEALRAANAPEKVELPPVESAVLSVATSGAVEGAGARFTSRLTLRVTTDSWTLCPLGKVLPSLGSVLLDGKPGWILTGNPSAGPAAAIDAKERLEPKPLEMYLLVSGAGEHVVEVTYSLPVVEDGDHTVLGGPLLPGPAGKLEVTVSGQVDGTSEPPALQSVPEGANTRFVLSVGSAQAFRLAWKARRGSSESQAVLEAQHALTLAPGHAGGVFAWKVGIEISRRKTGSLTLLEPRNATVTTLEGPFVHSWERTAEGLVVLLKAETLGRVDLLLGGLLPAGDRLEIGLPLVRGAISNPGHLAILEPGDQKLRVAVRTGLLEAAPGEGAFPPVTGISPRSSLLQVLSFATSEGTLQVEIAARPARIESRAVLALRATEESVTLEGKLAVHALEGRTWRLLLSAPPPWRLASLEEAPAGQGEQSHELRFEPLGPPGQGQYRIDLRRALDTGSPLELLLKLELAGIEGDRSWEQRDIAAELPRLLGAERSRFDFGVIHSASMDTTITDLPGWRALPSDAAQALGLAEASIALTSREAAPRIALQLVHRPARGEYRAVTYLLALEDRLRLRTDLQLALVDRPIDELVLVLPREAGDNVVVSAPGIKEMTLDAGTGRRQVRFSSPWLGLRSVRIELELPLAPGLPAAIHRLEVESPAAGGTLPGERFIVFQSRGAVEIEATPDQGLQTADVDETPSFGEAWPGGRIIAAYRFRPQGSPGTLRTTVHERAPVLRSLARELRLETQLGADGVARTRCELLLAYSRETHLALRLPPGSRALGISINGEAARSVRPGSSGEEIFIPLPPLSYAQIEILFESDSRGEPSPLGAVGTWSLAAPHLTDIPVSETRWTVHVPHGHHFELGPELEPLETTEPAPEDGYFWPGIFGLPGSSPALQVFRSLGTPRERGSPGAPQVPAAPAGPAPPAASRGPATQAVQQVAAGNAGANQLLQARRETEAPAAQQAPTMLFLPEGRVLAGHKVGGDGVLTLTYRSLRFERFARRTVWLGALVAGILLLIKLRPLRALALILIALVAITTVPVALAWPSPLFLVPLGEGLALSAAVVAVAGLLQARATRRAPRKSAASASALTFLVLGLPLAAPAQDGVLIPYDPSSPGLTARSGDRVVVPGETFRKLWALAHPETPVPGLPPGGDLLVGNARFRAVVEGESYRLTFRIDVKAATSAWTALPLGFTGRVTRISLDGSEAAVAQVSPATPPGGEPVPQLPVLPIRGAGAHVVEGEVVGPVVQDRGTFRIETPHVPGAQAVSLEVDLPAGARIVSPQAAITRTNAGRPTAIADLGPAARIEAAWVLPKIEGQTGTQTESRSFALLSAEPDGYSLERFEVLRVTGRPVAQIDYEVIGGWEVTAVLGQGVSDWGITRSAPGAAAEPPRLHVSFAEPASSAMLRIQGKKVAGGQGPVASLALVGAARQESFIGLRSSGGIRFAQNVLGGMRRAAREELQAFGLPGDVPAPDRIYHQYGACAGEMVTLEPAPIEVELATDSIFAVETSRQALSVRTRYVSVSGPGPLTHETLLPEGWTVRGVQAPGLASWEVLEAPRRLALRLARRLESGNEITWAAELPLTAAPESATVPFPRVLPPAGTGLRENVRWLLAAEDELELSVREAGALVPEALDAVSPWVELPRRTSFRLALRLPRGTQPQATGPGIGLTRRSSLLSATVTQVARVAEDAIHVNVRAQLRTRLGGRDRFALRLPPGASLESLEVLNERSRQIKRAPEGWEVEVLLQSPVSGESALDVAYRMPRVAGSAPVILPIQLVDGPARLTDVDQFVAVLQGGTTALAAGEATQLVRVEPQEVPFLPGGVSPASLQPAYRATGLDWALRLEERLIEVTRPGAVVDLAELTTIVGIDGTARTRATYTVRNRGLQFLVLDLPQTATLWGVTLNGKPVAVGRSPAAAQEETARRLRIPLEHVGAANLGLELAVLYEEPKLGLPALRGTAELTAPRVIDTQVAETVWNLRFPGGYTVTRSGGNLREVAASVLYAKRAENLLSQLDKISKTASSSESVRLQAEAEKELARVEQALSDNLVELSTGNRSQLEVDQSGRIGKAEIESQWADNDLTIQKARSAQEALRGLLDERKRKKQESAPRSREEQVFDDAANHMRHFWLDNRAAQGGAQGQAPAAGGAPSLDELLEAPLGKSRYSFAPVAGGEGAGPGSRPSTVGRGGGLKDLPDAAGAGPTPGLEAPLQKDAGTPFTFVNQGGDARLVIRFVREDVTPRLVAATAALLLPLAAWGLLRLARRGKGGRRLRELGPGESRGTARS